MQECARSEQSMAIQGYVLDHFALLVMTVKRKQKTGNCIFPCHCERSEAIQKKDAKQRTETDN